MSPGVHKIEALTLTDIEFGYSVNLRCVMLLVADGARNSYIRLPGLLWISWSTNLRIEHRVGSSSVKLHDKLIL